MKRTLLLFALPMLLLAAESDTATVFKAGENGYHTFRIPSLVLTKKGTLLAFCEGRKTSASDTGDIDTVMKRSTDDGKTWSELQVIADQGPNTIGNPTTVVERKTGTIWLLLTGNPGNTDEREIRTTGAKGTRTVWVTFSKDDGKSWAPLADITAMVKRPDWTWYATGPGNGIQLRNGRMLIACNHGVKDNPDTYTHVIYSDFLGATWQIGGTLPRKTDEAALVERSDHSVLLAMRNNLGLHRRMTAISYEAGDAWEHFDVADALVDPTCHASLTRVSDTIFFANPSDPNQRVRMTVRGSHDGGKTWPESKLIWEGPSAYSSMAPMKGEVIGLLYERGVKSPYEEITFVTIRDRF